MMHNNLDETRRRFGMSPPPDPSDAKYEEKLTNWFLEGAFFRDFVYRDQKGKGGRGELADGLVLFDDTAIFMQSKAQSGAKDGGAWVEKNMRTALGQICYGERMLRQRLVAQVVSDTLGPVAFDPDRYTQRIGLLVLDQEDTTPFVASDVVPELAQQAFPIHVLSLVDLIEVASRFDTASDFLFYLAERRELAASGVPLQVHRELDMARAMLEFFPMRARRHRPDCSSEVLERTVEAFRRKVTGELRGSADWLDSALVDDIIARLHERDTSLPWNHGGTTQDIIKAIELLSRLDRERRLLLGQKMRQAARDAADGTPRAFWRAMRFNRCCYVFLYSDLPRQERLQLAQAYLLAAMARSEMERGLIVATNSIAPGGRAYDVALRLEPLTEQETATWLAGPDAFWS